MRISIRQALIYHPTFHIGLTIPTTVIRRGSITACHGAPLHVLMCFVGARHASPAITDNDVFGMNNRNICNTCANTRITIINNILRIVIFILRPTQRIHSYIFCNAIKIIRIAYDMFMIRTLPCKADVMYIRKMRNRRFEITDYNRQ